MCQPYRRKDSTSWAAEAGSWQGQTCFTALLIFIATIWWIKKPRWIRHFTWDNAKYVPLEVLMNLCMFLCIYIKTPMLMDNTYLLHGYQVIKPNRNLGRAPVEWNGSLGTKAYARYQRKFSIQWDISCTILSLSRDKDKQLFVVLIKPQRGERSQSYRYCHGLVSLYRVAGAQVKQITGSWWNK